MPRAEYRRRGPVKERAWSPDDAIARLEEMADLEHGNCGNSDLPALEQIAARVAPYRAEKQKQGELKIGFSSPPGIPRKKLGKPKRTK